MGYPLWESSVMSKALASSFFLILRVVCAAFGISGSDPILEQRSEIAYTQFKRIVAEGIVSDVVLRGNRMLSFHNRGPLSTFLHSMGPRQYPCKSAHAF